MMKVKKKQLEIKLEEIPPHPNPKSDFEQYSTPARIASDILFNAYINQDIYSKNILDLGCGTGIFSLGCALLGAKEVTGIDIDEEAVHIANRFASKWDINHIVKFEVKDITDFEGVFDTVIMNPPFGAQKKGADIPFLKKALNSASRIYSIHNPKTEEYLKNFIAERGYRIFWEKRYMFEVDRIFDFHTKESKEIEVMLLALERGKNR